MVLASSIVLAAGTYLALGCVFAGPFVFVGVGRIDSDAREGTLGFRLLILPGAILLWPLLARRWRRGGSPPMERTPHKQALAAREERA